MAAAPRLRRRARRPRPRPADEPARPRQPRSLRCRRGAVLLRRRPDGADEQPRPYPAGAQADLPDQWRPRLRSKPWPACGECATWSHLAGRRRPPARSTRPAVREPPALHDEPPPAASRRGRCRCPTRTRACRTPAAGSLRPGRPSNEPARSPSASRRSRSPSPVRNAANRAAGCPRISRACGAAARRHAHAPAATWRSSLPAPAARLAEAAPRRQGRAELTQAELRGQARLLASVLADFGVKGEIKDVHPGPVVTLYEFEPARGVKSARVIGLADDLARSMGAACVRAAAYPAATPSASSCRTRGARRCTCASCSSRRRSAPRTRRCRWRSARTSPARRCSPTWRACRTCWSRARPARASRSASTP